MADANRITDVAGLRVGNAVDPEVRTGVTVLLCDRPVTASVDVRGGAPGTRDTDLLDPERTVESIEAIVLSGGSAFGLDASSGAQAFLREQGRGFSIGGVTVPVVPAAILFDLLNGGDKDWGRYPPYRELAYNAASEAAHDFETGSAGAGYGATTATLRGGLGTASARLDSGAMVGALVAVNAVGSATLADTPHFWAAPFEEAGEFGGLGLPHPLPDNARSLPIKGGDPGQNTTIGIVATDATLTKAECRRIAVAAHDGLARAIWPCHTALDGDTVFAISTNSEPSPADFVERAALEAASAAVIARAVAVAVYRAASSAGLAGLPPAWRDRFGNG